MTGQGDAASRGLLLFASIHHVLTAEIACRRRRIWCDLVPVPRRLSSDCGMALAFRWHDRAAIREAVAALAAAPVAIFLLEDGAADYRPTILDDEQF